MMPVNMRGPVKLDRDTANQTGYLQIRSPTMRRSPTCRTSSSCALRRRDHWASWAFLNISQIVGYAGIRHIFKFQMKRFQNRPFVGSFSNLGAWSGVGEWCMCPLVTLTSPVGVGAIVCDGRLALTVEAHASVKREAGWTQSLMDRWAALLQSAGLSDPRMARRAKYGSGSVAMPPTDDSEPLYPPFLAPPPEPLSLPGYFSAFVRNPLGATPAVVYREPIFQYRGRITYVTDPPLIKRILLDKFSDFPKTIIERYVFTRLLGKGILTSHGAEWRWQRQAAAPLFRHAEIQRYAPMMTEAAERVVTEWRRLPPGTLRLVDQDTTRAAFSVITETMLHSSDPAVTAALERANRDYLLPLSWPGVYGVLGLPEWLPYPRRGARRDAERDMRASVGNLVQRAARASRSRTT